MLTRRIQATNHAQPFDEATLAAAITQRDMFRLRQQAYTAIAESAAGAEKGFFRISRGEIRTVPTMPVADLRRQADAAASQWRQLDARIQSINWPVEVR
ncbi:MAG: DIP1984 family protein [Euryarchaeota archaeon]|nr:DIP1984 family protein [Euryarchaeota archaeon]